MSDETIRVAQILAGAEKGGAENFFVRLVKGLNSQPECQQKAFIRNYSHRIETLRNAGVITQGFSFGGKLDYLGRSKY